MRNKLPTDRTSIVHEFSISGTEGEIVVGLYEDGAPGEVFLHVAKSGSFVSGLFDGMAVLVSTALQHEVPLETLAEKFTDVRFEPSGPTGNPEIPTCTSIPDYVFRWLLLRFGAKSRSNSTTNGAVRNHR